MVAVPPQYIPDDRDNLHYISNRRFDRIILLWRCDESTGHAYLTIMLKAQIKAMYTPCRLKSLYTYSVAGFVTGLEHFRLWKYQSSKDAKTFQVGLALKREASESGIYRWWALIRHPRSIYAANSTIPSLALSIWYIDRSIFAWKLQLDICSNLFQCMNVESSSYGPLDYKQGPGGL